MLKEVRHMLVEKLPLKVGKKVGFRLCVRKMAIEIKKMLGVFLGSRQDEILVEIVLCGMLEEGQKRTWRMYQEWLKSASRRNNLPKAAINYTYTLSSLSHVIVLDGRFHLGESTIKMNSFFASLSIFIMENVHTLPTGAHHSWMWGYCGGIQQAF